MSFAFRLLFRTTVQRNVRHFCSEKAVKLAYSVAEASTPTSNNPILICHGLFGSKQNWKTLSSELAVLTNRKTYSFDVRNHGDSPHSPSMTYSAMANDLLAFMDENRTEKGVLIGHSLGGRIMFQFAFNFPERIEKMVIVDVGFKQLNLASKNSVLNLNLVKAMKDAILALPPNLTLSLARRQADVYLKEAVPDAFIRGFLLLNLRYNKQKNISWKYNLKAISELLEKGTVNEIKFTKPFNGDVLIIHGGRSEYVIPEDYDEIRKWLPNCKFECVKEGNHYLHIQSQEEFLQRVTSFINDRTNNDR